jgi:CheY-like chemotaxis protein
MASSVELTSAQSSRPDSRVLVVDDDPEVRIMLCEALCEEGYLADQATDGADAVRHIASQIHPDLLLMDLRMPIIDGYEFLERRKVDQTLRRIPVIVVSATVDRDIDDPTVQTVRKPFNLGELLRLIDRELKGQSPVKRSSRPNI